MNFQLYLIGKNKLNINRQNIKKENLLIKCIQQNDLNSISRLLEYPELNVNSQDMNKWSPLVHAVKCNNFPILAKLLQHPKIDVNSMTKRNWTALMFTTRSQEGVRRELNFNNHNIHIINDPEDTIEIIDKLLSHENIDINIQNLDGLDALMLSIRYKLEKLTIKLLKQKDVNLQTKNNNGSTFIDLIIRNNNSMYDSTKYQMGEILSTLIDIKDKEHVYPLIKYYINDHGMEHKFDDSIETLSTEITNKVLYNKESDIFYLNDLIKDMSVKYYLKL